MTRGLSSLAGLRTSQAGRRGKRIALVALLLTGLAAQVADASPASPSSAQFRVVEADETGLVVEWTAPHVELEALRDGAMSVRVPGYSRVEDPGRPALPVSSHLVAVPPGTTPSVRVLFADQHTQSLAAPLALVPAPKVVGVDGAQPPGGLGEADMVAQGRSVQEPIVFEEVGTVRGVRLARLAFYPVLEEGTSLRFTNQLRAEIRWDETDRVRTSATDLIIRALGDAVINPWDVISSPGALPASSVSEAPTDSPVAIIEVEVEGLYQVDYEELEALGFAGADPGTMRLFQGDEEVTFDWNGDGDAVFEEGEGLVFYANPRFSRWTHSDAFFLIADSVPRRPMTVRSASPDSLPGGAPSVERLAEENVVYTPDCFCGHLPAGRDGDRWAWIHLARPHESSADIPFDVEGLNASEDGEITLWFIGKTEDRRDDPDHRVEVSLNGHALGGVEWDGKAAVTATLPITAGLLATGDNTLSLNLPGISGVSTEACWLDAFSVRYARSDASLGPALQFIGESERRAYTVGLTDFSALRAYDVTDPLDPQRLTDVEVTAGGAVVGDPAAGWPRRYALAGSTGLMQPSRIRAQEAMWAYSGGLEPNGAHLLIVTHPDFADALDPLVALRESQGLLVVVANVLGIYDVWGDGRPDPEPIRSFIAGSYASWNPRPTYVLLVGDGSFDPRQYRPGSPFTFIPPYLADVDPWAGEAAADNRYACVDGDDALPDMLIGRLPVKSPEEAQAVVAKTVQYDTDPDGGMWNGKVVLTADDPDPGGDFPAMAETEAAAYVPSSYSVSRHYCTEGSGLSSDCPPASVDAIHDGLITDWNDGALLFGFFGHASWHQWAASRFFHLDDLISLDNQGRASIVVEMTCYTSAFQRPEATLDESLVTLGNAGAVVTWGGTGLGLVSSHRWLSEGFYGAVFVDEVQTVGEAALAGKLRLASTSPKSELLDTFVMLGDPGLVFNRTFIVNRVWIPVVWRNS